MGRGVVGIERLLVDESFVEHELSRIFRVAVQLIDEATRFKVRRRYQHQELACQFLLMAGYSLHMYIQDYVVIRHCFLPSPFSLRRTPPGDGIKVGFMQLGFVSAIVPELSFEEVFRLARSVGYDCVEVMCWPVGRADRRYAGVTHIDANALDDAAQARIHSVVRETGVSISGLGYYPNPLTPDVAEANAVVVQLQRVIAAAKALRVPVVNTFVGRDWVKSVDENWPRFLSVWTDLIRFAEDHGVRVAIENCPMLFTRDEWPGGKNLASSPAIWRRMFESLPSDSFGLNYDPSHLVWQQMDYLAPLREFASRIFHVHCKDVRVDRERLDQVGILAYPNEFHTPKLPGRGEIDWALFLALLRETGYEGPVCVEVEDRAYEGTAQLRRQALAESYGHLRQFIRK
jgi:sugar phosphate isomerase/epimerase